MKALKEVPGKSTDNRMDEIRKSSIFTNHKLFPETGDISVYDGIPASLFYDICQSTEVFSELTAIVQYMRDESAVGDETISEYLSQIGVIEMSHMDFWGDVISALGGERNQPFSNRKVKSYKNRKQIIEHAINSEETTIAYYKALIKTLKGYPDSRTRRVVLEGAQIAMEDETIHKEKLTELLKTL